MTNELIFAEAERLRNELGTAEPERAAAALNIPVVCQDMGHSAGACKGFFAVFCGVPIIAVNAALPEELRRIVLMHEIAHAVLHRELAEREALSDFRLFGGNDRCEFEANLFAAEYLMTDAETIEALEDGTGFSEAASSLCVPPQLLDFKLRAMNRRGYPVQGVLMAAGDFLRKLKQPL